VIPSSRSALPGARTGIAIGVEVRDALARGAPVVALETTLITHGLPRPQSLETGRRLEAAVREEGATPATVGVVGGELCVGLEPAGLERLARGPAEKIQARGLALALARRASGGTTVSATMRAAAHAGVRLLATGGIGGVHRGGELSLDVSEDLEELRRSPVAVVCAGAKAILDLARTLERLETLGVPVIGSRTGELPAFYSASSGLALPRLDGPEEVAELLRAHWEGLGERGGVVIANPPPAASALAASEVEALIEAALIEAARQGVRGKELTPFLLAELDRASGGRTVACNIELALANARLAARVARALCTATP
jgi:pseudouridine-5'-phosphate glycosidase